VLGLKIKAVPVTAILKTDQWMACFPRVWLSPLEPALEKRDPDDEKLREKFLKRLARCL
jgi:hypothetical protein